MEFKTVSTVEELPNPKDTSFVLFVDTNAINSIQEFLLNDFEIVKASSYKKHSDANNYKYRHHLLNLIITTVLQVPLKEIQYVFNEWKKPFLKSNPFYFNISHSGSVFCIACGPKEMAVDVEVIRDIESFKIVIQQHFNSNEIELMEKENIEQSFFRTWTRKEAYLKAKGIGLVNDLSQIDSSTAEIDGYILETNVFRNCVISIATDEKSVSSIKGYHYIMT